MTVVSGYVGDKGSQHKLYVIFALANVGKFIIASRSDVVVSMTSNS